MGPFLLLALIGVPILEIAVFIEAGERLGLWPTLAAVVLTAVVGAALLRYQGLSTLSRAKESIDAGQVPAAEIFDGLCLLIGGALLLTPGFVTDTLGLLLMVPPVRVALRRWSGAYLMERGLLDGWSDVSPAECQPPQQRPGPVIDGEFMEIIDGNERDGEAKGKRPSDDTNVDAGGPEKRL